MFSAARAAHCLLAALACSELGSRQARLVCGALARWAQCECWRAHATAALGAAAAAAAASSSSSSSASGAEGHTRVLTATQRPSGTTCAQLGQRGSRRWASWPEDGNGHTSRSFNQRPTWPLSLSLSLPPLAWAPILRPSPAANQRPAPGWTGRTKPQAGAATGRAAPTCARVRQCTRKATSALLSARIWTNLRWPSKSTLQRVSMAPGGGGRSTGERAARCV